MGGDQIVTRHAECERKIARSEGGREVDVVKRSDEEEDERASFRNHTTAESTEYVHVVQSKSSGVRLREWLAYCSAATVFAPPCPSVHALQRRPIRPHCIVFIITARYPYSVFDLTKAWFNLVHFPVHQTN